MQQKGPSVFRRRAFFDVRSHLKIMGIYHPNADRFCEGLREEWAVFHGMSDPFKAIKTALETALKEAFLPLAS